MNPFFMASMCGHLKADHAQNRTILIDSLSMYLDVLAQYPLFPAYLPHRQQLVSLFYAMFHLRKVEAKKEEGAYY